MTAWTPQDSEALYNLTAWGEGYFSINAEGHLTVRPHGDERQIDLSDLGARIADAGLRLPVLLRFTDILRDRVRRLHAAFETGMNAAGLPSTYLPVYPIKVNQQYSVIRAILDAEVPVGLEAGSKPELLAVLGLAPAGSTVVCNGYKDADYIELALRGAMLGLRVTLVLEKPFEVELVIRKAKALGIKPRLGIRMRMSTLGAGNWQNTGGERAKFGLSANQAVNAIERLRDAGLLDSLHMLHFHLGSQVANVDDLRQGMTEAVACYRSLREMGAPIDAIDVGGGLAVDYEGTRSRSYFSMNYDLEAYAAAVVEPLAALCREQDLPVPDLLSESGRALTAHHAVLVSDVIDVESVAREPLPEKAPPDPNAERLLALSRSGDGSPVAQYQAATESMALLRQAFADGRLTLQQRADAERCYFAALDRIAGTLDPSAKSHREARDEILDLLADKLFCNLSVFQSMPDIWALNQIFPIVPLQRLNEQPDRRVSLCDLTCDSDGRIEHYVDRDGVDTALPAHRMSPGERYLFGFFLVGAYQEILGDMHNLFGDTDTVNVELDDKGGWHFVEAEQGDRVDELLSYVHIEPDLLRQRYREKLAAAGADDAAQSACLDALERGLTGYSYLHQDNGSEDS